MSGKDIDGSIKGAKGWLSGNLRETTVVRDKVNHFLLHVLSVILHAVGTLSKSCGKVHVLTNLGSILVIFVGESPV